MLVGAPMLAVLATLVPEPGAGRRTSQQDIAARRAWERWSAIQRERRSTPTRTRLPSARTGGLVGTACRLAVFSDVPGFVALYDRGRRADMFAGPVSCERHVA